MPAKRHSTSQASSSESLVANSSLGNAAAGCPSRSMIKPPEWVSTAARICDNCAVSIKTRPFFTGNFVADGYLTNYGTGVMLGFGFLLVAVAMRLKNGEM